MEIRPTDLPLHDVADVPEVVLHQAVDLLWLWDLARRDDADAPLPFWAAAWAGGIGLARHVLDHPEQVAGCSVLDVATGSGLNAIAAMLAGAARVTASDLDPDALAAVEANAAANDVAVTPVHADALGGDPGGHDVVLIGDACYDAAIAARTRGFLERAAAAGVRVLLGDPGRPDLPIDLLVEVATYHVTDPAGLETEPAGPVTVWALR